MMVQESGGTGSGRSRRRSDRRPGVLYRVLAESSPDIVLLLSAEGRVLYANPVAERLVGKTTEGLRDRLMADVLPPALAARYEAAVRHVFDTGESYLAEALEASPASGTWLESRLVPVRNKAGRIVAAMAIARDITRRRRTEEALRASEQRYRTLFEESPLALWEEDFSEVKLRLDALRAQGVTDFAAHVAAYPETIGQLASLVKVIDVNRASLALYGASTKEHLIGDIARTFTETSLKTFGDELVTFAQGRYFFEGETATRTLDGQENFVALRVTVAPGYEHTLGRVLVSMYDLTERKRAEARLRRIRELEQTNTEQQQAEARAQAALREKEVLLREIHHRVKNNLQVIASLLRLGGERVGDEQAREVFRDSHGRIRSMALIHERLYMAGDLSRVPFREYLRNLTHELFGVHNAWARGVRLALDVDDTTLTLDVAIPCGLIIHELVSNALEHAFPPDVPAGAGEAGKSVGVMFHHLATGHYELKVADNGIGMPAPAELARRTSLGLELVETLVRQLGGVLARDQGPGCGVMIRFAERSGR